MYISNISLVAIILFAFVMGCILMLLIFFVMYISEYGVFSYCVSAQPVCTPSEYINNPTNALREGYQLQDILSVTGNTMRYKRPINSPCSPGSNQIVTIDYPQYCNFTDESGTTTLYRDIFFGANRYRIADNSDDTLITTSKNCVPVSPDFSSGQIVLRWDS